MTRPPLRTGPPPERRLFLWAEPGGDDWTPPKHRAALAIGYCWYNISQGGRAVVIDD